MTDISCITKNLFVASRLDETHLDAIKRLDIVLIISMIGQHKPPDEFSQKPFQLLWLRAYDTFLTPVPMKKLQQGVEMAKPVIDAGKNVLVYCHQGKRRSVTMAAAILIAFGYSADDAMALLKEKRTVVSPILWYVKKRIEKFERYWVRQ